MKNKLLMIMVLIIGLLVSCEKEEIIIVEEPETSTGTDTGGNGSNPNLPNENGDVGPEPDEISVNIAQQSLIDDILNIAINITESDTTQGTLLFDIFINGETTPIKTFTKQIIRGTTNVQESLDISEENIQNGQSLQVVVKNTSEPIFSFRTSTSSEPQTSTSLNVPITIDDVVINPVVINENQINTTATSATFTGSIDAQNSGVDTVIARVRQVGITNTEIGRRSIAVDQDSISELFQNLEQNTEYVLEFLTEDNSIPFLVEPFRTKIERIVVTEFRVEDIQVSGANLILELNSDFETERTLDIEIFNGSENLRINIDPIFALANTQDQEFSINLGDLSDQSNENLTVKLFDNAIQTVSDRVIRQVSFETPLQEIVGNIIVNNVQASSVDVNVTYRSNFPESRTAQVRMTQGNTVLGPIIVNNIAPNVDITDSVRTSISGTNIFAAGTVTVEFFYLTPENTEVGIDTTTFRAPENTTSVPSTGTPVSTLNPSNTNITTAEITYTPITARILPNRNIDLFEGQFTVNTDTQATRFTLYLRSSIVNIFSDLVLSIDGKSFNIETDNFSEISADFSRVTINLDGPTVQVPSGINTFTISGNTDSYSGTGTLEAYTAIEINQMFTNTNIPTNLVSLAIEQN